VAERTRLDVRGRRHLVLLTSRVARERGVVLPGYPYHPRWYAWLEHMRGCLACTGAAVEDEVCDVGLAKLNAFYAATLCRWETRPGAQENGAFWWRLRSRPGLI
jgi:hypothetical protein